jgi:[DsrC]-trisulfide reductase subunit J
MRRPAIIALISALMVIVAAAAAMRAFAENGTPVPHPAKGKAEHCVADTDFMRKNHMNMLLHHRTEAVHLGVRTPQYDLNGCVTCHAVAGSDGRPVSFESDQHFCKSCHSYAAVSIDCFECHASRPATQGKTASIEPADNEVAVIDQYLRDVRP